MEEVGEFFADYLIPGHMDSKLFKNQITIEKEMNINNKDNISKDNNNKINENIINDNDNNNDKDKINIKKKDSC